MGLRTGDNISLRVAKKARSRHGVGTADPSAVRRRLDKNRTGKSPAGTAGLADFRAWPIKTDTIDARNAL